MIKVTIGESYEIQATFSWFGTINFTGPESTYVNSGTLSFFSKESSDLKKAVILQEKYPDLFTDFDFYTEEGVKKVLFKTTPTSRLRIQ